MEGGFAEVDVYSGKDHLQGRGEQIAGYGVDLRGCGVYACVYFVSLFKVYQVGCVQEEMNGVYHVRIEKSLNDISGTC